MIALVAVFALPSGIAQADTLVSNAGQVASGGRASVTSTQSQAQAFTTGSGGGYDLEAVDVRVATFSGTASDISVSIYSEDSGDPDSVVHALSNPATIAGGTRTFTAPAGATMDADTTYFVVVSTTGTEALRLNRTVVDVEDTGRAIGWSIANSRSVGSGTTWSTSADALMIRVKGTDNTTPALDSAELSAATEVRLVFDEVLVSSSVADKSAFSVKVEGSPRTIVSRNLNSARTKITLVVDPGIRPGETVTVSYTKPSTNPLQDAAGNEVASFTDRAVANNLAPIAPEAPTNLHAKGVSATQIGLSWSAPEYTGGTSITGYRIEVSNDGNTGWTQLVASQTSRTYSHTVPAGVTRYYRVSAINSAGTGDPSNVASASAMDTPPTVTGAEIRTNARIVRLFFDEAPVSTSTPAASAFTVKVEGNARTPTTAVILTSPDQIQLILANAVRPGETVTVSYTKPGTNPLQDAAGTETASFTDFPVANNLPPIVPDAPTNLHAKGVSATQIGLSWSAPEYTGGADITGYRIEVSNDGNTGWTQLVASQTSRRYSHTVPAGATRYYRVSAINSAGTSPESNVASASAMDTAPGVTGAEIRTNARIVRLFFDEAPVSTSTPAASAFTVKVEGNARTPTTAVILTSPDQIQLILADAVRPGETVTVSYTKPGTNPLQDAAGTETASFTDFPVANNLPPIVPDAPTNLHAKGVSATQIGLSWSAPEYTGGADITGYRIEVSNDGNTGWTQLVASQTSRRYSHTVPAGATRYYRVSAINSAGTSPESNVASASAMDTAPGVTGAEIRTNARIVRLFFDEAPVSTSTPAASAFTVKVEGNARTPTTAVILTSPDQIQLILADAVRPGETVTVSYTKPGTNPLQDAAGTETASFTDFPVANNLPATAPEAPGNLAASPGTNAGTMDLTWDTPWANGSDITKFQVRHAEGSSPGGTWGDIDGSGATTTSHTVTGLTDGTQYIFQVRAVNGEGEGDEGDRHGEESDAGVALHAPRLERQ